MWRRGGHAGLYNPFAIIGELKPLLGDKALILSRCMVDGAAIAGAIAAGADLAYVGTRFVNTTESMASDHMKQMVIEAGIDDIEYSAEVDGVGANWLRRTMPQSNLRDGAAVGTMDVTSVLGEQKRWRDILSAGQGVGSTRDTVPAAVLVTRLEREFHAAADRLRQLAVSPRSNRAA